MTKDTPKKCALYANGNLVDIFPSKTKAKNARYWKNKEAKEEWLDLSYDIKEMKNS